MQNDQGRKNGWHQEPRLIKNDQGRRSGNPSGKHFCGQGPNCVARLKDRHNVEMKAQSGGLPKKQKSVLNPKRRHGYNTRARYA